MSSTNRGSPRRPNDDYQTPPWAIEALLAHVEPYGNFLEPCRGSGNILRAVQSRIMDWAAAPVPRDAIIPPERLPKIHWCEIADGRDFLTYNSAGVWYDWIITNPPYSLAREFIERSISMSSNTAMLLRLNFLESEERRGWWQSRLPTALYVLSRRPNFEDRDGNLIRGKDGRSGTDSCAYGWFVWSQFSNGIHVIGDPNRNGGRS